MHDEANELPALIQLSEDDPSVFLVMSSLPVTEDIGLVALNDLTIPGNPDLSSIVSMAVNSLDVAASAANSVIQAQMVMRGLVQLAPESIALLQAGATPLTSGGWNLGTLTSGSGKIAAQIRWLPATGAAAAVPAGVAGVAAVAQALSMLALAWQISRVQKSIDRLTKIANQMLMEQRIERLGGLLATIERLTEIRVATANGSSIPSAMQGELGLLRVRLGESLKVSQQLLNNHLTTFQATPSNKRPEWLTRDANQAIIEARSAIWSNQGMLLIDLLQASLEVQTHPDVSLNLSKKCYARFEQEQGNLTDLIVSLARQGQYEFGEWSDHSSKTRHKAADWIQSLVEPIPDLEMPLVAPQPMALQEAWSAIKPEGDLARLKLLMARGETLISFLSYPRNAVVITSRRVFVWNRRKGRAHITNVDTALVDRAKLVDDLMIDWNWRLPATSKSREVSVELCGSVKNDRQVALKEFEKLNEYIRNSTRVMSDYQKSVESINKLQDGVTVPKLAFEVSRT